MGHQLGSYMAFIRAFAIAGPSARISLRDPVRNQNATEAAFKRFVSNTCSIWSRSTSALSAQGHWSGSSRMIRYIKVHIDIDVIVWCLCALYRVVQKNWHPLFCTAFYTPKFHQILTDFQTYFTVWIRRTFVITLSLKISPHLKCVATLPCEMSMS